MSAKEDLALASSCNHSIIDVGSYGFWGAYLAGGETIYPHIVTTSEYRFSKSRYEAAAIDNFTPLIP